MKNKLVYNAPETAVMMVEVASPLNQTSLTSGNNGTSTTVNPYTDGGEQEMSKENNSSVWDD